MAPAAGSAVGSYTLEAPLGEGAMGVVWRAKRAGTEERFAIKLMKSASPDVNARLRREARVIASLRHPSVVRVFEVVETEDGSPALVMELLVGETLRDKLTRESRLAYRDVAVIVRGVAGAMAAASAAGVVHRDLKPDNVFLVDGDVAQLRVLDFGVAKVVDEATVTSAGLTSTGVVLGTPYYMAPEQVFGDDTIDSRADAWALGVLAFECLAGKRPTQAPNVGQVLRMIARGELPRLADVAPDVSASACEAVTQMLATDRDARLSDWSAIAAAFPEAPRVATAVASPSTGTTPRRRPLVPAIALGSAALLVGALALKASVSQSVPSQASASASTTSPPPPLVTPSVSQAEADVAPPPTPAAQVAITTSPDAAPRSAPTPVTRPSASARPLVDAATAPAASGHIDPFHGLAVDAPF